MPMQHLLLDRLEERAARIRRFAEDPANHYTPTKTTWHRGDRPELRLENTTLTAVFTITIDPHTGEVYRQLTVSSPDPVRYPHPVLVFTVAHALGFSGVTPNEDGVVHDAAPHWKAGMHPTEPGVITVLEATTLEAVAASFASLPPLSSPTSAQPTAYA